MLLLKKIRLEKVLRFTPLAAQAFIRLFASFLTVKVVTAYIAPSQFIIFGQLQTLMQIYSVSTTSIASTKFSSLIAAREAVVTRDKVTDSALIMIIVLTIIALIASVFFSDAIVKYIGVQLSDIYIWMLPIGACATAYLALMQGYFTAVGATIRFGKNGIISAALIAMSTVVMTMVFGFKGALISTAVSPIIAALVLGIFDNPIKRRPSFANWDCIVAKEICGFAAASVFTLVGYYCAQLYIRSRYAINVSAYEAGLLSAAAKISDVYMGVISVIFANILIRSYASTNCEKKFATLAKMSSLCAAVLAPGFLLVGGTAEYWIPIILSEAYSAANFHVAMQLVADFVKCLYWVFIYFVISKYSYITYLLLESAGLIIYLVVALTDPFGIEKFSPQLAQMFEYAVLIILVNAVLVAKKNV